MRVLLIASVLLFSTATARAGQMVWLETERFAQLGGWVNDAQFLDVMGSPYLLANGWGTPVADASTTVELPAAGTYRLWARTKDWFPEHHPGRFQILLGGNAIGHVFGESGRAGWHWEDGGSHALPAGRLAVALRDLTGYYGRCDAIVLTRDAAWTPPDDLAGIARLREIHGGVSRRIKDMPPADVVVAGGGLAGCTAAVAAARNGARVVLIQNRPVLGGNASTEILVPPVGLWPHGKTLHPLEPRETGLVEEYRTAGNQRVREGKLYSSRLLRWVKSEPRLALHLNTHATGVEMQPGEGKRIAAVLAVATRSGQRMRFPARFVIDCTGEGSVGAAAGADFRHGKEPKSMYHEPWAPKKPSKQTMGNGLKYVHVDTGTPQPFVAPPWIFRFPRCSDFRGGRHPRIMRGDAIGYQWNMELGGLRDTIRDAEEIRDDLYRLIFGLWDHMKNHCAKYARDVATHKLVWVSHVAGKRESRRLLGDYVLTQNDIGAQTLFADRVAFGGWSTDDHYSGGFFHKGTTAQHFNRTTGHYRGRIFSIPYRCLYSRNVENLLMAGRDVSASHLGMSNIRVMLTCAVMGHAAGTAAGMCAGRDTTPRGIYQNHLADLQQQLLKEGATLLGLKADDPRDLAPKARVTASSEGTYEGKTMPAANVIDGFARLDGGHPRAWLPDPKATGPHWVQLAWDKPPDGARGKPITFNMVHLAFQTVGLSPSRFAVQAWVDGAWKELFALADNRHRRHVLGLNRVTTSKLRVVVGQPRGICEIRVYDEPAERVESARRAHKNMRLGDRGPFLPWKPRPAGPKLPGIVIDADQAEQTGTWVWSNWSQPYMGDGYLHDGDTDKGRKAIRFSLAPPTPGRYEVRLAYVAFTNRATNTPVTVASASGRKRILVNQRTKPPVAGMLLGLGTFALDKDSALEVRNDNTDGYVVVDAVQLVPEKKP